MTLSALFAITSIMCTDSKFDATKNDPVFLEATINHQDELWFDLGNLEPYQGSVYKRRGVSGVLQVVSKNGEPLTLTGHFGTKLVLTPTGKTGQYAGLMDGIIDTITTPATPEHETVYDMERVENYPLDCVVE
jgi:hypothetical protein